MPTLWKRKEGKKAKERKREERKKSKKKSTGKRGRKEVKRKGRAFCYGSEHHIRRGKIYRKCSKES